PNAGKSTLLNRIAKREVAIVSPYAGTTRDVIEVHLDLHGLPVTLLDTAGIRETEDPIEREGVRRARARAGGADLILWVVDAGDVARPGEAGSAPHSNNDVENSVGSHTSGRAPTWLVRNKIDLHQGLIRRNEQRVQSKGKNEPSLPVNKPLKNMANKALREKNETEFTFNESAFDVSATTGEGFDVLLAALAHHAGHFLAGAEPALVTRERHRHALQETVAALRRALAPDMSVREDILAEELRLAARALGRLTGRVDVDDVLDVIF